MDSKPAQNPASPAQSPSKVIRTTPFTAGTRAEFLAHCLAVKFPDRQGQIVQLPNGMTCCVLLSDKYWMRTLAKHMVWPVELS